MMSPPPVSASSSRSASKGDGAASEERIQQQQRVVNREASMTVQEVFQVPSKSLEPQMSALSDQSGGGGGGSNNNNEGNSKNYRKQTSSDITSKKITGGKSMKSSVTYGGQDSLPPLPVPSLDSTLNKFLACLEALQEDKEERLEAQQIVIDFMKSGDGPKLQQLLVEYDKNGRENGTIGSYVEEFWNDSYLAPDSSVVLNLNPFFVLEDSPDPKIARDPIRRAANLTFASVKLASQLRREELRPDTHRDKPLCMDQFRSLFGTARVPMKKSKDSIVIYDNPNHIAVMCRSQIYYFQVLWPDGDVAVDEKDLVDILTAIRSHADELDPVKTTQEAIGVLTSLSRKEWAIAREELISFDQRNEESLQIVDSALFLLVLDDYIPQNKHDAASNMLHGSYNLKFSSTLNADYQEGSCCNRWYDKLQIIVCGCGTAGINFEHSAIDGHTALRFVSDVYAETVISFAQSITKLVQAHDTIPNVINAKVRRAAVHLDNAGKTTLDVFPKAITFHLPQSVENKIYFAETALGDEIVASETHVLEFKDYGKQFIVGNKLSPDSFVQMSMLIAYYKLYGKIVCAYEPVLTKSFFHGRTEAMRPATMEAKHLVETFCNPKSSNESKLAALRNATQVHSQFVKECARGKGVDRHLFALKCIAEKNNLPMPEFFRSRPWNLLNHTILSTSNCGNPSLALFGFGPVVADGLGIGYIIKNYSINYSISSKHRQTQRYAFTLRSVLRDMAKLLKSTNVDSTPIVEERSSLKSIPRHMISYDSYGDIWGESTPHSTPQKSEKRKVDRSSASNDSNMDSLAVLASLDSSADTLGEDLDTPIPNTKDDVDGVETKPARRWAAEEKSLGIVSDGEEDGAMGQATSPKATSERGNGKRMFRGKRQNAKDGSDGVPIVPCRKSSVMGGAKRHASFDYLELSQKGLSISMAPKEFEDIGEDDSVRTPAERQMREDVGVRRSPATAPQK